MYKTIEVHGQHHVVRETKRQPSLRGLTQGVVIEEPNYKNTGMALCGILKKDQTLAEFIEGFELKKGKKKTNDLSLDD